MVVVIQYLRGLAALLVVYAHLDTQTSRISPDQHLPYASIGIWGVDIFFVISGFIMYVAAIEIDAKPGHFLLRRAIRIVPLYWSLTALIVAGAYVAPTMFVSTRLDASHILASFLFLPWSNPAYEGFWPVLIPGWTLNYEMYFYAAVAIGLFAPRRLRIILTSAIVIGVLVAVQTSKSTGPVSFYGNDIVIEFLFGLLAGYMFTRVRPLGTPLGLLLIGLSFCLVIWMADMESVPRSIAYGIPAMMVVLGSLQLEGLARHAPFRPALHLGDISYSLYLTHVVTLPMATAIFVRLGAQYGFGAWPYPFVATLWALLLASLVYLAIEKPLTRTLRGATGERRAPPMPAFDPPAQRGSTIVPDEPYPRPAAEDVAGSTRI
ncbi:acyltransferase family protein [Bosea sp. (in: a-proteobacteria)]|jgi:exopolysaccharide production protein ExoZ|uniref:acyltransferase family protein n=1 Tax=Bosea sp. (in: a-proteobacteria) TaxID=1871050 RepID=UPI003F72958C